MDGALLRGTERAQGRGVGSTVLRRVLAEAHPGGTKLRVLRGSAARRLYERYGFVRDDEDDIDVYLTLDRSGAVPPVHDPRCRP